MNRAANSPQPGRPPRRLAALSLLLFVCVLVAAASASADSRIGDTVGPGVAEFTAGGLVFPRGLAVDQASGDIYQLDAASGQRVDVFDPAKPASEQFLRAFGWGIVPGAATAIGNLIANSTSVTAATTTSGRLVEGEPISGPGIPPGTEIQEGGINANELVLTKPAEATEPGATLTVAAGPGNVATNEVQEVTVRATTGQLKLSFTSPNPGASTATTAELPAAATHQEVQAAIEALPNVGSGNVSVSGGPGDAEGASPYLVEFTGKLADANVEQLGAANVGLGGGNPSSAVSVTTATQGAGALETCTTTCVKGQEGSEPGQLRWSDEIAVDQSSGDVYVLDQRNFRIEKFSPEGEFLLMFGAEVDQGPHHPGDVCTAEYLAEGDVCGAGAPGTGPAHFYERSSVQRWSGEGTNSIAVGPDGSVYVGDFRRVQHFSSEGAYLGEMKMPEAALIGSLAVDAESHVYADALAEDEEQLATPTGSSYRLTFEGQTTGSIPAGASNNGSCGTSSQRPGECPVSEALEKLPTIGKGNVRVETSPRGARIVFVGALADRNLPQLEATEATVETIAEGAASDLVELAGPNAAEPSEVLRTLDASGEPTHIAFDSSGDLFVSEQPPVSSSSPECHERFAACPLEVFREFSPSGALTAEFSSPLVIDQGSGPPGIAVGDAAPALYAPASLSNGNVTTEHYIAEVSLPQPGPPQVSELKVSDDEPETATLHAIVNPEQFDTHYQFQFIAQRKYEEDGNSFGAGTESTPASPSDLGSISREDPVQAAISGLHPETAYRFRVIATNQEGEAKPEESFETLPAVSVRHLATQTVGPELVSFKAELNPNGRPSHWVLRYDGEAGEGSVEGNLPPGSEFVALESEGREGITFTGLKPNTTYHYQLSAENSFGHIATADATFTTEPSAAEERAAEDCPENGTVHGEVKSTLREENNSLALPDCRAYEQVSERHKAGGNVFGTSDLAPSGERLLYGSGGVFDGASVDEATALYLAHRTPTGWVTQPVIGRPAEQADVQPTTTQNELAFSPELDRWLFDEVPALQQQEGFHDTNSFYLSLGLADGSYVLHASPEFNVLEGPPRDVFETVPFTMDDGQSYGAENLSRLYFRSNSRLLASDPRPDARTVNGHILSLTTDADRLYELSEIGGPSPTLALVAELPSGLANVQPTGGTTNCGIDSAGTTNQGILSNETARFVSADGSTVVFTMPIELAANKPCAPLGPNPVGLFIHHVGQSTPLQLNAAPPAQCHSPHPCATAPATEPRFAGLSLDGRRAWFTTAQPLVDSDTNASGDLYLAKLDENGELEELVQASASINAGEPAGVIGAERVSPDGSRVAFLATGVLTAEQNALHQSAVSGADNLYVYDAETATTKFVTHLCSGLERSGALADPGCLGDEAGTGQGFLGNKPPFVFSADDRYLVFQSQARLTPDDTDKAIDVYRYDFQTGNLVRLTFGRDGNAANGNEEHVEARLPLHGDIGAAGQLAEDGARGVAANGRLVVFETASPLVSSDTNTQRIAEGSPLPEDGKCTTSGGCVFGVDVYEWEESGYGTCHQSEDGSGGCVRLVSDGVDPQGASNAIVSASGRDITFHTARGEVPGDTDGVGDIYDARENGGFHFVEPAEICKAKSAEGCHGKPTDAQLPINPVTEKIEHGPEGEGEIQCAKGRHKVKKHNQVRCVANHSPKRRHHRRPHHRAGAKQGGQK